MRRLVLHIGNPKVGSTSIQQVFDQNPEALAAAGVYYPRQGRGKPGKFDAHHNLSAQYSSSGRARARFNPAQGGWAEALAEADAQPLPTVVISSETFSTLGAREVKRLGALLTGRPVDIFLYLRRHDLWFRSQHNEAVKFGRRGLDVDSFLADRLSGDSVYRAIIQKWTFAPVHVRPVLNGENIVGSFARECSIDEGMLANKDARRNASVPLKLLVAAVRLKEQCSEALGTDFKVGSGTTVKLSHFFRTRKDWFPRYSLFSIEHARIIETNYYNEAKELAALTGKPFDPIREEEYAGYVADPLALKFDEEETAFLAHLRQEIVRRTSTRDPQAGAALTKDQARLVARAIANVETPAEFQQLSDEDRRTYRQAAWRVATALSKRTHLAK